jgi:ferredoxin
MIDVAESDWMKDNLPYRSLSEVARQLGSEMSGDPLLEMASAAVESREVDMLVEACKRLGVYYMLKDECNECGEVCPHVCPDCLLEIDSDDEDEE